MDFDTFDPLYPEMKFLPDARESEAAWRACPQNPWTVASHSLNGDHIPTTLQQHPKALVFRTTSAMVSLAPPASRNYVETPGFVKLDIIADISSIIGQLAQVPLSWLDETLNTHVHHEIIVLAAGIATKPMRYAQTHPTLHVSGYIQQPRSTESPWYLHVMLIKRDHSGVAERVSIGTVEMGSWKQCKPECCTVVLV